MIRWQARPLPGSLLSRTSSFSQSRTQAQPRFIRCQTELALARKWLERFKPNSLPRDIGEVSFSRSSGPGGQNVNKVNTKAQLRIPLDRLLPYLPTLLHSSLLSSHYYAEKSRSLLIQADASRKQSTNLSACYYKLHQLLVGLAEEQVPGETSQSQKERVKQLQKSDKEVRLRDKRHHAGKKASRSKDRDD